MIMKINVTWHEVVLYSGTTTMSPNIYTVFLRSPDVDTETFKKVNSPMTIEGRLSHDIECDDSGKYLKIHLQNLTTGNRFRGLITEVENFYNKIILNKGDYRDIIEILTCYGDGLKNSTLKDEINEELRQLSDEFWKHLHNNTWSHLSMSDKYLFEILFRKHVYLFGT